MLRRLAEQLGLMEEPSPDQLFQRAGRIQQVVRPWEWLLNPSFSGWENIPEDRPLLFVGNHTLFGILDAPFLWVGLFREKGIVLRGLGDKLHFQIPGWRELMNRYGIVLAEPAQCSRLMEKGEAILVFPGGAREVTKRKGERYQLIWKERRGFARLAVQHGCTIVPFASVGIEDMFHVVLDGDEVAASPVGGLLERLRIRKDVLMPLAVGKGPLGLPRLQRLYFHFGPAIHTKGLDPQDEDAVWSVRETTRLSIEESIEMLRQKQRQDPKRFPFFPTLR
ncbi:MAG: acyltransferase family protein [Myxococcales bacterium]|nr:acyltransferase family protein [Myxococcales bacterium]MCB9642559.1 acyltransferase family protein [Myxococcales bacterium]